MQKFGNTCSFKLYKDFLVPRVNRDLYVYGAQGQQLVKILPSICEMTGTLGKVDNILTCLADRFKQGFDQSNIYCYDCSGLFMNFAIQMGIYKYDMNANEIWESIEQKVEWTQAKEGDFVFEGNSSNKWHIGYVVDNKGTVIEARGTAYGVVQTELLKRDWKYAARPAFWSDIPTPGPTPGPIPPTPSKVVLTRELKYTNPMMRGTDVEDVQERLNELSYNCGPADSVFGKKTDIAVRNFQSDNKLTVDGIIGRHTCGALGFIWEG